MRISDWSSDVCSSDLILFPAQPFSDALDILPGAAQALRPLLRVRLGTAGRRSAAVIDHGIQISYRLAVQDLPPEQVKSLDTVRAPMERVDEVCAINLIDREVLGVTGPAQHPNPQTRK